MQDTPAVLELEAKCTALRQQLSALNQHISAYTALIALRKQEITTTEIALETAVTEHRTAKLAQYVTQ